MSVYMSVEYTIYALHGVRVCVCNHHNSHELNNLLKQAKCEWCFDNWIQSPHGVTSFMCPRCCVMPLSMASKSWKRRGRKLKKKTLKFSNKTWKICKTRWHPAISFKGSLQAHEQQEKLKEAAAATTQKYSELFWHIWHTHCSYTLIH